MLKIRSENVERKYEKLPGKSHQKFVQTRGDMKNMKENNGKASK